MKRVFTQLFFTGFLLAFSTGLFANYIVVKGYVKYNNGNPFAKHFVKLSVDSTTNPTCFYINSKMTDSSGFYIDTLTCNADIKKLRITTEDCNGALLVNTPSTVPGTIIVESNFIVSCAAPVPLPPVTCSDSIFYSVQSSNANFSSKSSVITGDSVISRIWNFGDSSAILTGNIVDPSHQYSKSGIYNACLTIQTAKGCTSKACASVSVTNNNSGYFIIVRGNVKYNNGAPFPNHTVKLSVDSTANPTCYYINSRITDATGFYIDTLTCNTAIKKLIVTTEDCNGNKLINTATIVAGTNIVESNFIVSCAGPVPPPVVSCSDSIFYAIQSGYVKFNSKSTVMSGDSVISRSWNFGDSSALLTGNIVDPSHQYTNPGTYNACLTIKTAKGCESKACIAVAVTKNNITCAAAFGYTRTAIKRSVFNSSSSVTAAGDSIVERIWSFGDGTTLTGNENSPAKAFPLQGIYNVCLKIKTAKGCESETCNTVVIQDSIMPAPGGTDKLVKIITINPNPVSSKLAATIWSKDNNISAEISIYDIYGIRKWSSKKSLLQGNNVVEISATGYLISGPYFLRVSTAYGTESRSFYKL